MSVFHVFCLFVFLGLKLVSDLPYDIRRRKPIGLDADGVRIAGIERGEHRVLPCIGSVGSFKTEASPRHCDTAGKFIRISTRQTNYDQARSSPLRHGFDILKYHELGRVIEC